MTRDDEIRILRNNLIRAQVYEDERKANSVNLAYTREGIDALKQTILETEKVIRRLQTAALAYKSERLRLLELEMTNNLANVFPNRNFRAEFSPEMYRGSEILELLVGEGKRLAPTKMQNGRLVRQLINVSGSTMIQILCGCKLIILDEATNSGDSESLEDVSEIFRFLLELGYQLIIIEHKHEVYNHLPRLQYNLAYDHENKKAKVVSKNVYT